MKNTPGKSKSKKKRKSKGASKRSTDKPVSVPSPNISRPRRASCRNKGLFKNCTSIFNLTVGIRRKLSTIKRVIQNDVHRLPTQKVPDTCQISINNRLTSFSKLREGVGIKENANLLKRCSKQFLKCRTIKLVNGTSYSSNMPFSNINITFEEMLNIRKKRLTRKYEHTASPNNGRNIEIKNSNVEVIHLNVENENGKNNNREVEENKKPEDKSMEIIDVDDTISVTDSMMLVDLCQETPLEVPSLITAKPEITNNGWVIDQPTFAPNPSVDLTFPMNSGENNDIKALFPSVNDSVITIPDTPDCSLDKFDRDIIFISEIRKANYATVPIPQCIQNSSVIILDDDDEVKPPTGQPIPRVRLKRRSVKFPGVNSIAKKKIKKKKRLNKKMKQHLKVISTATKNTSTSELASCADTNCVNRPKLKRVTSHTAQLCACQSNKGACNVTPNLDSVPEESVTATYGDTSRRPILQTSVFSFNQTKVFGSNIYNAGCVRKEGLREIIIDGSNVALGHSNGRLFSVKGLQIAIDYFVKKGHKVTAFVPQYRQKYSQCSNPDLLRQLANRRFVIFTPSREVKGRRITPYDDRFIIQYAATCEGIVVSNDNYRDLLQERPEWRETIERRILMHTWVDDMLMFPEDPLGRHGPTLSRFLRFP